MKTATILTFSLLAFCALVGNVLAIEYSEIDHCGCDDYLNLETVQFLLGTNSEMYSNVSAANVGGVIEVSVQQPAYLAGTGLKVTAWSYVNGVKVTTSSSDYLPHIDSKGIVHLFVDIPEVESGNFFLDVYSHDGFFAQYQVIE